MRVIVAPDKFKGSASARVVARAVAEGVADALPDAEIVLCPMADGGEGTTEVLLDARGGSCERSWVTDPLGRPVEATWAHLEDGSVVLDSAAASGLDLVAPDERKAGRASTFGTGGLLLAASASASQRTIVGVGGTATTDGGTGAAAAAGWSFLDSTGRSLPPGGAELVRLARIEPPPDYGISAPVSIVAACDVDVPLFGPRGAARGFAPQKGASSAEVRLLEKGLKVLAGRIEEDLETDVFALGHAGAGGGLGAGLAVFFGAELVSGFDFVAGEVGLADALRGADIVVTGEGRLDDQSLQGKCTGGVARLAAAHGSTCFVVAGQVTLDSETLERAGFARAVALADLYGTAAAMARPAELLRQATRDLIPNGLK